MKTYIDDLDADPILIAHDGRLLWQFPSGRTVSVVRGGDDPDPDEKKFTQADVDRLIADRLKRAESKVPADYDQLKADAAELAKLKAAQADADAKNKTEAEKTQKRLDDLEAELKKSNDAAAASKADALEEKRRGAIVAAAARHKAVNPDQVAQLLKKDAVTIGDDGQVTGADEAVTAFLTENPHHVGEKAPTRRMAPDEGQGKGNGTPTPGSAGKAEAVKRFGTPAAATTK